MRKVAVLLIAAIAATFLFGCSKIKNEISSESAGNQKMIGTILDFNLYTEEQQNNHSIKNEAQSEIDLYEGYWNTETGSVSVDFQKKVFQYKGDAPYSVVATWDGKNRYLLSREEGVREKNPGKEFTFISSQKGAPAVSGTIYGDGYSFSLSDDQVCNLRIDRNDETIIFPSLSYQVEIEGKLFDMADTEDFWLLGSGMTHEDLYLLWGIPEKSKVIVSILSTEKIEVSWSDVYDVSERYQDLIFSSDIAHCPFLEQKFYFSMNNTIGSFDVNTGEFFDFEKETDLLDSIITNTNRRVFSEGILSVNIIGCSEEAIIGLVQYQNSSSDRMYNVCFAIGKERLLGAFCYELSQHGVTISTYDSNLKKQQEKTIREVTDQKVEILWQNPNNFY